MLFKKLNLRKIIGLLMVITLLSNYGVLDVSVNAKSTSENFAPEEKFWEYREEIGYYVDSYYHGQEIPDYADRWHKVTLDGKEGYMAVDQDGGSCVIDFDVTKYKYAIKKGGVEYHTSIDVGNKSWIQTDSATVEVIILNEGWDDWTHFDETWILDRCVMVAPSHGSWSGAAIDWFLFDGVEKIRFIFRANDTDTTGIFGIPNIETGSYIVFAEPELYLIDKEAPRLTNAFIENDKKRYKTDDIITIKLYFDEEVRIKNPDSNWININGIEGAKAYYVEGNESPYLTFQYTVRAEDVYLEDTALSLSFEDDTQITDIIGPGNQLLPYNISIGAVKINDVNAPTISGDIVKEGYLGDLDYRMFYYEYADFTKVFEDLDQDEVAAIRIESLPDKGLLLMGKNGKEMVSVGDVIHKMDMYQLSYKSELSWTGEIQFTYTAIDDSPSSQESNIGTSRVSVFPGYETLAPIVVDEDTMYKFTLSDFEIADKDKLNYADQIGFWKFPDENIGNLAYSDNGIEFFEFPDESIILPKDAIDYLYFIPSINAYGDTELLFTVGYSSLLNRIPITVNSVNDKPVIQSFSKKYTIDTPLMFAKSDFTSNYTDIETDMKNVTIKSLPLEGTLGLINTDGNLEPLNIDDVVQALDLDKLQFEPLTGSSNNLEFQWMASDGVLNSEVEHVHIVINDAPVVSEVNVTSNEDTKYVFSISDFENMFTDNEGDTLVSIVITALPDKGELLRLLNGDYIAVNLEEIILREDIGFLEYKPEGDFSGQDRFKWIGMDQFWASNESAVNVEILPVNDAPVVTDFYKQKIDDLNVVFAPLDFESHFTDKESNLTKIIIKSLPSIGTLTYMGADVKIDDDIVMASIDQFIYVPISGPSSDVEFEWQGFDGALNSNTAHVFISGNTPPLVSQVEFNGQESSYVGLRQLKFKESFSDVDDTDSLEEIKFMSLPSHGILKTYENGQRVDVKVGESYSIQKVDSMMYIPNDGFVGSETISWQGSDGHYFSNEALLLFHISEKNECPIIRDIDKVSTDGSDIIISAKDFFTHYYDEEGDSLKAIIIPELPLGGTLYYEDIEVQNGAEFEINDSFELRFSPSVQFEGLTYFRYIATDGNSYCNSKAVRLTVNKSPIASDISKSGFEDTSIVMSQVDFTSAYSDSDPLEHIRIEGLPEHGKLMLNGNKINEKQKIDTNELDLISFVPEEHWFGMDVVEYSDYDGTSYSANANINIRIDSVNDKPTMEAIFIVIDENEDLIISKAELLRVYDDVEDDEFTKFRITTSIHSAIGELSLNDPKELIGPEIDMADFDTLNFDFNADVTGEHRVIYQVYDGIDWSEECSIVVSIVSDELAVKAASENLQIGYSEGDSQDSVKNEVHLEDKGLQGTTITWSSSNEAIISPFGRVIRPNFALGNQQVTLIATISKGLAETIKTFDLNVIHGDEIIIEPDELYTVRVSSEPAGVATFIGYGTGFSDGSPYQVSISQLTEGYEFVGWQGASSGTVNGADVNIIAKFNLIEEVVNEPIAEDLGDLEGNLVDEKTPQEVMARDMYFDDLSDYAWASEAINRMVAEEIIFGRGNVFEPGEKVTRGEFTTYLVNLMGAYNEEAIEFFDDVDEQSELYHYIASGYEAGLIEGYSASKFGPNDFITREDIMVIMSRLLKTKFGDEVKTCTVEVLPFDDTTQISDYAENAVCISFINLLIEGYYEEEGHYVRPLNNMNRAEAAVVIERLFELFN